MPTTPNGGRPTGRPGSATVLSFLAAGDLTAFSWLASDAARAPRLAARVALSRAAADQVAHYGALTALLDEVGAPHDGVGPFLELLEEVRTRTEAAGWEERLLRTAVIGGMVRDLGEVLAELLAPEHRERALAERVWTEELAVALVGQRLADDEPLRARLSLWGRRIAGEALGVLPPVVAALTAAVVAEGGPAEGVTALHTPAMSAMSSRHAQRMDALGLTA